MNKMQPAELTIIDIIEEKHKLEIELFEVKETLRDAKGIIKKLLIPPPMQYPLIKVTAQMWLQGAGE